MTAEHEIDKQFEDLYRKAEGDDNSHRSEQHVSGPVIDNRNQISTPALVTLLVAFFVSATIGALAVGMAWNALDMAHQAEREGRLAQERADRLEVDVKVMMATQK